MATTSRVPISQILRNKDDTEEDDEPKKKSREDWRKAKELEEARKAGTAPAAVDETGLSILTLSYSWFQLFVNKIKLSIVLM